MCLQLELTTCQQLQDQTPDAKRQGTTADSAGLGMLLLTALWGDAWVDLCRDDVAHTATNIPDSSYGGASPRKSRNHCCIRIALSKNE